VGPPRHTRKKPALSPKPAEQTTGVLIDMLIETQRADWDRPRAASAWRAPMPAGGAWLSSAGLGGKRLSVRLGLRLGLKFRVHFDAEDRA
jgi:hypothetical protein